MNNFKNHRLVIVGSKMSGRGVKFDETNKQFVRSAKAMGIKHIKSLHIENKSYEQTKKTIVNALDDDTLLIIMSGDGMVHTAFNACLDSGYKNLVVGILPLGSSNDFSRAVNNPFDNPADLLQSQMINFRPMDVLVNGKHEFYSVQGVGLGATYNLMKTIDDVKYRKLTARRRIITRFTMLGANTAAYLRLAVKVRTSKEILPTSRESDDNNIMFLLGSLGSVFRPPINHHVLDDLGFFYHTSNIDGKLYRDLPRLKKWLSAGVPGESFTEKSLHFDNPIDLPTQVEGRIMIIPKVKTFTVKRADKTIQILSDKLSKSN